MPTVVVLVCKCGVNKSGQWGRILPSLCCIVLIRLPCCIILELVHINKMQFNLVQHPMGIGHLWKGWNVALFC